MKYSFITQYKKTWPVDIMCRPLGVICDVVARQKGFRPVFPNYVTKKTNTAWRTSIGGDIYLTITQGIDPIQQKVKDTATKEADAFNAVKDEATFKVVALEYIDTKKAEWKNPKHTAQWLNTLVTYAFPKIGSMPVDSIDTQHILKVVKPIWKEVVLKIRTGC
jgi:hypothetical protein